MAIQQIGNLVAAAASQGVAAPRRPTAASDDSRPAEIRLPGQALPPPPGQAPLADAMEDAVAAVRMAVAPVARNLQFSIDKETGKTVITVVDAVTKEVIRQIPGEEILAIARAIDRMQGLLFDREV